MPCEIWLGADLGFATGLPGGGGGGSGPGGAVVLVLLAIGVEAVDIVGNTGAAVYAAVEDDVAVRYGGFGYLLSWLPGITLLAEALPELPVAIRVTPKQWQLLQDAGQEERCRILADLLAPSLGSTHATVYAVRFGKPVTSPW